MPYLTFTDQRGTRVRGSVRITTAGPDNNTTTIKIGRITRTFDTTELNALLSKHLNVAAPAPPKVVEVPVYVNPSQTLVKYRNLRGSECIKPITSLKVMEETFEGYDNDVLVIDLPIRNLISIERPTP